MFLAKTTKELQEKLNEVKKYGTIGFVPTMGALHQGHISLVKKAVAENKTVVVSIFVNPTQFNNIDDFVNYPKTIKDDIKILQDNNCDILYCPENTDLYKANEKSKEYSFNFIELY